jgi:hypothetical protein
VIRRVDQFRPFALSAITLTVLALLLTNSPKGKAADGGDDSRVQQGFNIAPVKLNLTGKNRALVGLGSYIVNSSGDCNGCHAGLAGEFSAGGDPFQGQPKKLNPDAYLAGGNPLFGPFFIPRNLTPDKSGLPEGGSSFEEFQSILRTGVDPDHAHPQFGLLLQVMPWPNFQNLTDNDLRAIYEYLSSIPCIEGDPGLPHPRPLGTRCK